MGRRRVARSRTRPRTNPLGVPGTPSRWVAQQLVGFLHRLERGGAATCVGMSSSHRSPVGVMDCRLISAFRHPENVIGIKSGAHIGQR